MIHQNIVKISTDFIRPAGASAIPDQAIPVPARLKATPRILDDYVFTTTSRVKPTPSLWDMDYPERRKPHQSPRWFDQLVFTTSSNTVPNASLWDQQNRPARRVAGTFILPETPFIAKPVIWDTPIRPAKRQFSPFVLPEAPIITVAAPTLFLDAPIALPAKVRAAVRITQDITFTATFKAWDVLNRPPARRTPSAFVLPDVRTFEPTVNPVFWDEEVRRPSKIASAPRTFDSWTFTRTANPALWGVVPPPRPGPRPVVALPHDTPILAIQAPYLPIDEALRPRPRVHALTIIWQDDFISPTLPPPPPPAPCIPFRSDASLVYQTRSNSLSAVITRETVQMSDQSRTETTGSGQSRPESDPTDISRPNTKVKDCKND